jgi:N-acetylmuramoyl-L-alanine amidase
MFRFSLPILFIFLSLNGCQIFSPRQNIWEPSDLENPIPYSQLIPEPYYGPAIESRWESSATAILLHTTNRLNPKEFLDKSWRSQWNVHLVIDKQGIIYGEEFPGTKIYPTAPGIDKNAIHIAVEGYPKQILSNPIQIQTLKRLVQSISSKHKIPLSNYDIDERTGIFTHIQSKKRYGGFINLKEYGESSLLSEVLLGLNGEYFTENEWKDRFATKWVLRKEDTAAIKKKFNPDRGRGISPTPTVELENIEKTSDNKAIEDYRVRYVHRGKIKPSCLVLHYTATGSFTRALEILESRSLTATIMVDKDGKAYQLLDSLSEQPSTAYGTNERCIQIEIVGTDSNDLASNQIQIDKVVALVKEISQNYDFPISNHRIEEFKGVYSHTQAKKKFGGSIFLTAKDFDPGEEYMKTILELAGGEFYPEENWFERNSNHWVILVRDFQP